MNKIISSRFLTFGLVHYLYSINRSMFGYHHRTKEQYQGCQERGLCGFGDVQRIIGVSIAIGVHYTAAGIGNSEYYRQGECNPPAAMELLLWTLKRQNLALSYATGSHD
jgi:hypothetical protein